MVAQESKSPTRPTIWVGAMMIATGVVAGIISATLFCWAIGINFTDEGWSERGRGLTDSGVWMLGGAAGCLVAGIVLFWFGMYKLTTPNPVAIRRATVGESDAKN